MYTLEQFHYGQLVHHEQVTGTMRVLAKSAGITDELVHLCLRTARVPALSGSNGVSWGMIRTERGQPMVMARAEIGRAGETIYQFIILTTEIARMLAGNLKALAPHVTQPLPTYTMLGDSLPLVQIDDPVPSTEEQVDSLLELLSHVHSNTRNIMPILSAVVTGRQLVIRNAPPQPEPRMSFVQGLLALLPASTRFGVTYLLHNTLDSDVSAQVMFMDVEPDDENFVVFDWETGKTSDNIATNDYSRFITGQMRLDLELVVRETGKLTRAAGWRFNSGASLSDALDYASHRSSLDQAIQTGMPVEADAVAKVLAEDPTLSMDDRLMYARHLVKFSLALEDLTHIDAVTATLHNHRELEDEVYDYLAQALEKGQFSSIFDALVRWRDNPFSPQGLRWQQMLHKSALMELDDILHHQDVEGLSEYLDQLMNLGTIMRPVMPRVIDKSLRLAGQDPQIPAKMLLLAINHLEDDKLRRLMGSVRFVRPLPVDVKRLLVLFSKHDRNAPRGTLIRAVDSLSPAVRDKALLAFAKVAYISQRIDLFDERVLGELVEALNHNHDAIESALSAAIARSVQDQTLPHLRPPAPRFVLQLLIRSDNYELLSQGMTAQSRDIYGPDRQLEYIHSVREAFAKTKLDPEKAKEAIKALEENGIHGVTLLAAMLGALEGSGWDSLLQFMAVRSMKELRNNPQMIEVLPAEVALSLVQFEARIGDYERLHVAAHIVGSCAAYDASKVGLKITNQGFKMLNANERTKPYAIEIVRQYVREAAENPARHIIKFYHDRLGNEIGDTLQLSYEFSNLMGRMDWLEYATSLQIAVDLVQAMVEAYEDKKRQPDLQITRQMADMMRRDTDLNLHSALHDDIRQLAHAIVILGQRHDRRSSNSDRHIAGLVEGQNDPRSTLDVYRTAGGHLLSKKVHPFRINTGNINVPLGTANGADMAINLSIASNILHQATNARPSSRDMWTAAMVIDEIDSRTKALIGDHDTLLRQMGRNWQRLADLVFHIYKNNDTRIIEANNSRGKKLDNLDMAPASTLDLLRFLYGQFQR